MNYEELSISGFIKEMKDVSYGPHPRKFCFVLGAGASITSGIKSGQELVDIWEKELHERNSAAHNEWKSKNGITTDNPYSFYSQYYERRFNRQPIDGYNYLEKMMEHAKPNAGYVMLAYLLENTPHNVVITTNFDHLVEDAVGYYSNTIPLVIGHEALAHYITGKITRPTIVKIHRDLLFDPKNKTNELEALHDSWKNALDILFENYHPVFIGYAGNDNSLMDYLIDNSPKFLHNEWCFPYWMLYKTDKLNGKTLRFLQQAGGYYIRHSGFDESLYLMGAAFDYKIPSEENFINDARKRFQDLSNSIDKFTEKLSDHKDEASNESENLTEAIYQITDQSEMQRIYREATTLHKEKKYEEALLLKKQLTRLAPENALYHYSLSDTLNKMGEYEKSFDEAKKAADLDPRFALYHYGKANALYGMEKYEEALAAAQKAVDLAPEDAFYHYILCRVLEKLRNYNRALDEIRKATELKPNDAFYHYYLGEFFDDMEQYQIAAAEKQLAVELMPEDETYRKSLAYTLSKLEN